MPGCPMEVFECAERFFCGFCHRYYYNAHFDTTVQIFDISYHTVWIAAMVMERLFDSGLFL